ncbi:MmgE/PrpD family protein [Verticiella sediminum]|nr:MmgE/PrpD family protein [Verticiella sediminum]
MSPADVRIDTALRRLCDWLARTQRADIPHDIQLAAAHIMADDLACGVCADAHRPLAALTSRYGTSRAPGDGLARVWSAEPVWLPCRDAAGLNAIRANWNQLDGGHTAVMCHAGLYTVGPALAAAEAWGADLPTLVRAVALSYEATCRLARAWCQADAPSHPHALWGACGAFLALATLGGLERDAMLDGLLAAASLSPGPSFSLTASGSPLPYLWVGASVRQGFLCLDWHASGLTRPAPGIATVMTGLTGVQGDVNALAVPTPDGWSMRQAYHKHYACAQQGTAALEAALLAHRGATSTQRAALPDRIVVTVHPFALTMDNPEPESEFAARFSIPHLVAVAWCTGRDDALALGGALLHEPTVALIRKRVQLVPAPAAGPQDRAARVSVQWRGKPPLEHECTAARGTPGRPLAAHELREKCDRLAERAFARLRHALFAFAPANASPTPVRDLMDG